MKYSKEDVSRLRSGAYIIRALEGRPSRVAPRAPGPDYTPPEPTEEDRRLARELIAYKLAKQIPPPEVL